MKIQIENLKAFMQGRVLTMHQTGDAIAEFDRLVAYTEELEQLNLAFVSVPKGTVCPCCDGTGICEDIDDEVGACITCGGSGQTAR